MIYQIFPRSFRDSDGDGVGDLRGIASQLDYIASLGANTLWLNPHYPSTTYHGYDVVDYKTVNPQLGTLEDFKFLVAELKRRNMRVFVDFVGNHSSDAHPFFRDAYRNPKSKYTSWYKFADAGNVGYTSFFGVKELPEWNVDNPAVRDYLADAAMFWLDLGVDGLRCDYALGPGRAYWRDLRARIKARHPNAAMLGEVWDADPGKLNSYFLGGFDALFDFPWYLTNSGGDGAINGGALNGREPVALLKSAHLVSQVMYPRGAQVVRFVGNHDTNRVASAVSGDSARMRLAAAQLLLSPGVPMMYYGDEIGMRGTKGRGPIYDEYRREPMDWYRAERGPGMTRWFAPDDRNNRPDDGVSVEEQAGVSDSLLTLYRDLGKLRSENPALRSTQFEIIETPECDACISMLRWDDATGQLAWFVYNASAGTQRVKRPSVLPAGSGLAARGVELTGGEARLGAWQWGIAIWQR